MYKGVQSGLASFGSPTYAAYFADAMANSWSRNLGIDGYTIDCSANYDGCMLQTKHAQSDFYNKIVGEVRKTQPQVVMSGEGYGSWDEVLQTNSQMGGQGSNRYHEAMQQAVFDGDASNLELIAGTSGADAATIVCYLHPGYDGEQPGICASISPLSSAMCHRWLPHYVLPRLNSHNQLSLSASIVGCLGGRLWYHLRA